MSGHNSILGREVVYDDSGLSHSTTGGHHGGGGSISTTPTSTPTSQTLVGSSTGLQFDLIWDSSVANAPSGFTADVINTATYLASLFSTHEIINVNVGWGEVGGQLMSSGALGQSQTNGYLENYAAISSQLGSALHIASNEPTNAQFFISSAEAKGFGVVSATSTAVDGSIGFGSGYSWNMTYGANGVGTATTSAQYDLQSVILHELSEVMGRISMEGANFNGAPTYTALDLFDYQAPGTLALSNAGGYFSTDGGVTSLGHFNDAALYGGDIADWSSYSGPLASGTGLTDGNQDAFNAFTWNGVAGDLSHTDLLLMGSIGYSSPDLAV